jgi:hypothetical protein
LASTDFVKKSRHSHSNADTIARRARRKDALDSGISKSVSPRARHTTIGCVIGDTVFVPGSPITTLPDLLQEAELTLNSPAKLPYTPSVADDDQSSDVDTGSDVARPWTRDDWKQLDACFTDERLVVYARTGQGEDALADVDDVDITNVVARFVDKNGGMEMLSRFGQEWTE